MILPKPIVGKILRGEVTHILRPGTSRPPRLNARVFVKSSQREPVACHVLIREILVRTAGEIDYDWARKLGYRTTDDFRLAWLFAQDKAWSEWLPSEDEPVGEDPMQRFYDHHRDRRVFLVRFEVDRTEHPRLLADRNARADYVESPAMALSHEPEAVDERTQDKFSREGHQGFVARERARELDREHLQMEERMRLVRAEACTRGVSIEHLERAILEKLRKAERKVHRRAA